MWRIDILHKTLNHGFHSFTLFCVCLSYAQKETNRIKNCLFSIFLFSMLLCCQ